MLSLFESPPSLAVTHELVLVHRGTLTARQGNRILLVPDGFALWIPAGSLYTTSTTPYTSVQKVRLRDRPSPVHLAVPTALEWIAPARSRASHIAFDAGTAASVRDLEAVVLDLLTPAPAMLTITLPSEANLRELAERVLLDPVGEHPTDLYAALVGITPRTLSDRFRRQTGVSWPRWRSTVTMHHAVLLLNHGGTVGEVAHRVGYAGPSTFISAFARLFEVKPSTFKRGTSRPSARADADPRDAVSSRGVDDLRG